jgi:uncharacterized protein
LLLRLVSNSLLVCLIAIASCAQDLAAPTPERLVVHSNVLKEDRVIWVRMPAAARRSKAACPVLYLTDAGSHINEIGSTIDFLAENDRIPPLIVVGITNTDRNRDLTPTHADIKSPDGKVVMTMPTSGGADHFLDFIQNELVPEIDKRYSTQPFRIFAGHSLGGLLAIYALMTRDDLFHAYIAVSPSLQWDDGRILHQAQKFFTSRKELKKTLFFSLANEGNAPSQIGDDFQQLQKMLSGNLPKDFVVQVAHYPDEDHGSTVLLAHYAGLRAVFPNWQLPRDEATGLPTGGLPGIEQHYRELSERYGFTVSSENAINQLGYALLVRSQTSEAITVFKRNVELYPHSANTYDSLADGFEAAGQSDQAIQTLEKAVAIGTEANDPLLSDFKKHLERLTAAGKSTPGRNGETK